MNAAGVVVPRARVIVDNDFGGDPDGLFQLAHHLLSPSVDVRAVVGSPHYPAGFYGLPGSAEFACDMARQVVRLIPSARDVPVLLGSATPLKDARSPVASDGAAFIVREALRDDVRSPLYIACGAGLSTLASALLMEPRIGGRLHLVWIGGPEHAGLGVPPPNASPVEYNLGIDRVAAQVVFDAADVPIWQVPRDAYRRALASYAELHREVRPHGPLGALLMSRLDDLLTRAGRSLGEAYVLGDSPLVLLTALQSGWEPDPSSSDYALVPRPRITDAGTYEPRPNAAPIRVYTRLDTRLMLADFYAKLAG